MLIFSLLAVAPSWATDGNISGSGSETDPYIIHDAKDWETFAKEVNNGNTYVDKYIKLELDISVTQQVGSHTEIKVGNSTVSIDKPFSGTFDGNGRSIHANIFESNGIGTALFGCINGAIIKNLTVTGEIHGGIHAAGLVGVSMGAKNRIENCVVSTTVNGDTHIGGILGHGSTSDIAIDNCVFNGILDGGSKAKGVFFGWGDNGGTKIVSNCLYIQQDGQSMDNLDLVKMNAGSVAVTDCYKTAEVGTYGALVYLVAPTDAITEEKTVAGDTKFYVVTKKLSLTGSGSESAPYIINNADQWDEFAEFVRDGASFAGKFIKLSANIAVSTKVGVVNGGSLVAPFSGTFDGGGNTITASIEDVDNSGTALFSYISGATIKNLTLAGNVTGGIHAAGIVGYSNGTGNKIENCVVSATINGGSHIGGFLGHGLTSDISIDNCVFRGMLVHGETAKGVFFGWGDNGGAKTVSNCLYIQQDGQNTDNLDLVKMDAGSVAVTDCYKTKNVGTYGKLVFLNAPANEILLEKIASDGTQFYIVAVSISGVKSYYLYTDEEIALTYKVTDVEGNELIKNKDYTATFTPSLVKDKGDYTLTITAIDGGIYTGSKTISFTVFDGTVTATTTAMTSGIYRVSSNVTVDERIVVTGDVTLILDEGKTLTALKGIDVSSGNMLTIEGMGSLYATGDNYAAGIGGGDNGSGGTITINGGTVIATGNNGAGIGGGDNGSGGTITINGGTVTATGGLGAAGIGGGNGGSGGIINIINGTVTATGGMYGAGLGGGENGSGETIYIVSGTVTATGGMFGAGLGGGRGGTGGIIIISGETVTATGGMYGAGLGGGENGSGGAIYISGGTVTATGGDGGAGLGGGEYGSGGAIYISGGKVTANAGMHASSIGSGFIVSGSVENGIVYLGYTTEDDFIYASSYGHVEIFFENCPFDFDPENYKVTVEYGYGYSQSFYYTENGINKVASTPIDIAGKELHPYYGEHNLKNASISSIEPSYTYTGDEIIPTFKIVDFNGDEVSNDNYVFSITKDGIETQAVNTGEYIMVFTGKGNYEGTKKVKFSIVPEVVHNYAAVQVLKDENGTRAVIDGEYSGTDAVKITEDIENVAVTFNRKFTVDLETGGYSTLMLPFSVSTEDVEGIEGIYKFAYVGVCIKNSKKEGVCVNKVWESSDTKHNTLEANTPYMVKMNKSTLKIKTNVTLKATSDATVYDQNAAESERESKWQMRGVFGYKKWACNDGELGKVWGYTGEPRNGVKIGKFTKFGHDVWINPFRAYLYDPSEKPQECTDGSNPQPVAASPYAKAYTADFLPANSAASATASSEVASIDEFGGMQVIVIEDESGKSIAGGKGTTAVGRMNPATGEIRMQPRTKQTYDLKGRRVKEGKNAKGAYYKK